MPLGLTVALAFAAQAAPSAAAASPEPATTTEACRQAPPSPDTIVVCAERPEGFRIDPDILTARKMKRSGGRPVRPGPDGTKDRSPCVVGPHGCPSAAINLIGAALTATEMASRLLKGQEIGSMFVTDPQPSEYQLYLAAKRAREARAAEKAAKARKAK